MLIWTNYNGLEMTDADRADDEPEQQQTQRAPEPRSRDEDEPMLYCPLCSTRLASRNCKLFCEKCGYYMSCADYY